MKTKYLSMRYGPEMVPVIGFNVFFAIIFIGAALKNGLGFIQSYLSGYMTLFLIFNIVNTVIMYPKMRNKIGFDGNSVYALAGGGESFSRTRAHSRMALDEIETVDLRSDVNDPSKYKSYMNLSVIVLYRRGWDGDERFALDPRWANKNQFRDLISTIYDRHPEAFTENAKRYVDGGYTDPPRIDECGEFIW